MNKLMAMMMLSLVLVGCSTIEGAGKDIKKAGEAVEKAAQ